MDKAKKGVFNRQKKSSCCCDFEIEEISENNAQKDNTTCCAGSSSCCSNSPTLERKKILIDYLFLDLSVCIRCQGTEDALDEAINDVVKVLEATGTDVVVKKIHVDTKEKAIEYKFLSSPTIRINGQDIQLDYKESLCESCGDLCGDNVDCRIWIYQGQEYNSAPKAMIIEAILMAVYGNEIEKTEEKEYVLPENLDYFYKVMDVKRRRGL